LDESVDIFIQSQGDFVKKSPNDYKKIAQPIFFSAKISPKSFGDFFFKKFCPIQNFFAQSGHTDIRLKSFVLKARLISLFGQLDLFCIFIGYHLEKQYDFLSHILSQNW
jgi:hypothetical protein